MKKMNLKLLEQKSRIQLVSSLLMTITRQGSCGVQLTPPSYFPLFCFFFGASLQKTTIPCWVFPFFCFIYLQCFIAEDHGLMLGFPFWVFLFWEDFVDEKQEGLRSQTRGQSRGQTWPQFKENSNELWVFFVWSFH